MSSLLGTPQESAARQRVTAIWTAFPGAQIDGDQHLSCVVRRKTFVYYVVDHHGDGRIAIHCRAAPGENELRADANPRRYFIPPYVGPRGWAGCYLDIADVDWDDIETMLRNAYLLAVPKRLARELTGDGQ